MMIALPRRSIPSISGLIAFEATARHLSFSQAAKELSLSQGAVSKRLKQLERTLGVSLLARTKQQVLLTDAGRQYLRDVRRVLDHVESTTCSLIANANSKAVLSLATLPAFTNQWLLPRLPVFNRRHPGIVVNLTTRLTPFDFAEERFDGAIHFGRRTWPDAKAHYLFDEEIVPVANPKLVKQHNIVAPADMCDVTLLHLRSRPGLWSDWFQSCDETVAHPYTGPVYDQFSIAIRAAECGVGAALVPRFMIEGELANQSLTILFERPLTNAGAYHFVTPNTKADDTTIGIFRDWLTEESRSYIQAKQYLGPDPQSNAGTAKTGGSGVIRADRQAARELLTVIEPRPEHAVLVPAGEDHHQTA